MTWMSLNALIVAVVVLWLVIDLVIPTVAVWICCRDGYKIKRYIGPLLLQWLFFSEIILAGILSPDAPNAVVLRALVLPVRVIAWGLLIAFSLVTLYYGRREGQRMKHLPWVIVASVVGGFLITFVYVPVLFSGWWWRAEESLRWGVI